MVCLYGVMDGTEYSLPCNYAIIKFYYAHQAGDLPHLVPNVSIAVSLSSAAPPLVCAHLGRN